MFWEYPTGKKPCLDPIEWLISNFEKLKNQMISRIENPADCGFSIVDSMSHLIFGFLTIEPSKSGIG